MAGTYSTIPPSESCNQTSLLQGSALHIAETNPLNAFTVCAVNTAKIPEPTEPKKQTKSRNGCHTCKQKRLKCDEIKPSCNQCTKRKIECGGYKRDFKWKSFEESMAGPKPTVSQSHNRKKSAAGPRVDKRSRRPSSPRAGRPLFVSMTSDTNQFNGEERANCSSEDISPPRNEPEPTLPSSSDRSKGNGRRPSTGDSEGALYLGALDHFDAEYVAAPCVDSSDDAALYLDSQDVGEYDFDLSFAGLELDNTGHSEICVQTSPECHWSQGSFEEGANRNQQTPPLSPDLDTGLGPFQCWEYPTQSSSAPPILTQPFFNIGNDELLLGRFNQDTCGIMSIRNGPSENPWRTLIAPLIQSNRGLFHAIASMASFHASKFVPELREHGCHHMKYSLRLLRENLHSQPAEISLATTIALAFAESWDSAISTGIDHIKGAKGLIMQGFAEVKASAPHDPEFAVKRERWKFLSKTWIYIDVIARLTSVDDDESDDFARLAGLLAQEPSRDVDPLMGCASTLFPIIGHVANLVRRVCKVENTSPAIVSLAGKLKDALERWTPPSHFEDPEDPATAVQDGLQTAEAYRWATLLYLYQAVPELPSPAASRLGMKVMKYLATVPLSSRTVIVQIYPLLAGGCEATTQEDRQWVRDRWQAMGTRMAIGNIDRCAEVVQEVWDRRDMHAACKVKGWTSMDPEQQYGLSNNVDLVDNLEWNGLITDAARRMIIEHREVSRPSRPDFTRRKVPADDLIGSMDPEFTVRGRLHWVGVMKDWRWEVLLG